jgi:glycosyltransferase involved in cell wall biosynthesis
MPGTRPRLMLVLPQLPLDPASGAARTMSLIASLLTEHGFDVRVVATTASELAAPYDPISLIQALGQTPRHETRAGSRLLHFTHDGVPCVLLDVGYSNPESWRRWHVPAFDALLFDEIKTFSPNVVLTYGGYPDDIARLDRLAAAHIPAVLGLWNLGYLSADRGFFDRFAAILTPSNFLSVAYRDRLGIASTPLPTPVRPAEVRAEIHDPIFFTMVNPTWEKGLSILIRLADLLGKRRPDIPMLIVESRGTAGAMVATARPFGIDLAAHGNLMFTPSVASLVPEGSGRIASESLVAGIPPIVSDRGGLPEEVGAGGFVIPMPAHARPQSRDVADESLAMPWFDLIERLADDESFYQAACERARLESVRFLPETLAPRYAEFFSKFAAAGP